MLLLRTTSINNYRIFTLQVFSLFFGDKKVLSFKFSFAPHLLYFFLIFAPTFRLIFLSAVPLFTVFYLYPTLMSRCDTVKNNGCRKMLKKMMRKKKHSVRKILLILFFSLTYTFLMNFLIRIQLFPVAEKRRRKKVGIFRRQ